MATQKRRRRRSTEYQTLEGWTSGNPVEIEPRNQELHNQSRVHFCSTRRRRACSRKKECDLFRPCCTHDRDVMVYGRHGSRYRHYGVVLEDQSSAFRIEVRKREAAVIHTKLERPWRRCRKIRITVVNLDG
ncbi:hypothetical protein LCGC14_0858470 [marine sediment metagenome]|uniref:Uncharacterized protein n=1 Tax=marine sediment metagenome TaxID=412755 RepID=A0A0F9P820_9ZZZZ